MKTGLEGRYVIKNNKKMALGYTTGSCAAAAAKAAVTMILTRSMVPFVQIGTPKGISLHLEVLNPHLEGNKASCAIRKDAGDDPDVTDQALICAEVILGEETGRLNITLDGGIGVGRVTKPGMEQAIGEAAINKIPRKMIKEAVGQVCQHCGYAGEVFVEISVPDGEQLAQKTFNPRLGVVGGISILGTSGIVEPMSEEALIASIRLEMSMCRSNGADYAVIAPGNYGVDYMTAHYPVVGEKIIKCSNYLGETIDMAVELGFRGILFVSHIGKSIKAAGGIMNTHSRCSDARMEILAANAIRAGADTDTAGRILEAVTTEDGIAILEQKGMLDAVMPLLMEKLSFYLNHRAYGNLELAILVFSNVYGELGRIGNIDGLLEKTDIWTEEKR